MRLPASRYTVPRGSATGCAVTTKEASKASGIFPDVDGPDGFCKILYRIMAKVAYCGIMPVDLQQRIQKETGVKLHITYVRKIMRLYNLSPKVAQKIHINRADKEAA